MSTQHDIVREQYGAIAREGGSCCSPTCCSGPDADDQSRRVGYSDDELAAVAEGANLGLGCGNPQAIAALKPGERVLDLGSGGGFDAFLAGQQVGETGSVIGVDMTPDMLARARRNAVEMGTTNVVFRLGEIEALPVADGSVDVIISNCVINLSPDKPAVFREAFRVLDSGGRLAIADVVARAALPEELKSDELLAGCVAGAEPVERIRAWLEEAGFVDVRIAPKDDSAAFISDWVPGTRVADYIVSAVIEAVRP